MSAQAECYPDLDADERTTLNQFLDHYRRRALAHLERLTDDRAHMRSLPATNLTPARVVMLEETACHVGHLNLLTDPF